MRLIRQIIPALLLILLCNVCAGKIIYVQDITSGANIGTSWENAINSLQDALLLAYFYDEPVEIRVAQGIYTPDKGVGIIPGDREATFQLMSNVTIKGGYAGLGTPDPEVRDIDRFTSILSGDLNSNDNSSRANKREENSYHVVTANGTNATAVLDGFTITGGNANGLNPYNYGGGMYNDISNPMLINCTFSDNSANAGGGMYNNNSNPLLLNCIFNRNSTAQCGGGMYNDNSSPKLTNCKFTGNTGGIEGGGGMYNTHGSLMLADCIFCENLTSGHGAGIYNDQSNLVLLNCEFIANSSQNNGGGIFSNYPSELNLTNCIFSRNSAAVGGGMEKLNGSDAILYNCTFSNNSADNEGGGISIWEGCLTLTNCILWGNTPDEISGPAHVSYSTIKNGSDIWSDWLDMTYEGEEGNIDTDPQFADPDNGDYHLKSQAGRWDPNSESWVIDEVSSPCIDRGNPNSPIGQERFPNGGRINMGAYGGTPQASLSPRHLRLSPLQASNPYPPDGAEDVETDVTLSWTPGLNAISHDVYFGTNTAPMFVGNQIGTEFDPGFLDGDRTYYWRVDEVTGENEIITGAVWSFTTEAPTAPPKGRACFIDETPVWINGKLVPISKAGSEQTICRTNSMGKIREVQEHPGTFVCYDVVLESGNCISVAQCHYFLEESDRWISLQELKAGTKLRTKNSSIEIISVTKRPTPYVGKVYNLKIEGSDRYLVGKDAIIVRDY